MVQAAICQCTTENNLMYFFSQVFCVFKVFAKFLIPTHHFETTQGTSASLLILKVLRR
jgi:hypothetical protein